MTELPPLLGLSDLAERWQRSREYVRLHMRDADDFPDAAGSINGGRNRFWLVADLEDYEARHPTVRAGHASRQAARSEGRSERPASARAAPSHAASADRAGRPAGGSEPSPAPSPASPSSPSSSPPAGRPAPRARRMPLALVLGFTFEQKPPFEFRERLKRQGWTYASERREWIGRVPTKDAQGWLEDFDAAGARRVRTEPIYE